MDVSHFKYYSIVSGRVTLDLDLSRFADQIKKAQTLLGEQVLADCKPYMPHQTGNFQQRSYTADGGKRVIFPGPYGRFLWGGKVMVGAQSKSPWARKGEKKVVTSKDLTFSQPGATAEWFNTAKKNHGQQWIDMVKKVAGGG